MVKLYAVLGYIIGTIIILVALFYWWKVHRSRNTNRSTITRAPSERNQVCRTYSQTPPTSIRVPLGGSSQNASRSAPYPLDPSGFPSEPPPPPLGFGYDDNNCDLILPPAPASCPYPRHQRQVGFESVDNHPDLTPHFEQGSFQYPPQRSRAPYPTDTSSAAPYPSARRIPYHPDLISSNFDPPITSMPMPSASRAPYPPALCIGDMPVSPRRVAPYPPENSSRVSSNHGGPPPPSYREATRR